MLELVHEVVTQRRGTLKEFLSHWDRRGHKRSIRVSGAQDAVQIMTPHKAKGLDFKVVIAPVHPEKNRPIQGRNSGSVGRRAIRTSGGALAGQRPKRHGHGARASS